MFVLKEKRERERDDISWFRFLICYSIYESYLPISMIVGTGNHEIDLDIKKQWNTTARELSNNKCATVSPNN